MYAEDLERVRGNLESAQTELLRLYESLKAVPITPENAPVVYNVMGSVFTTLALLHTTLIPDTATVSAPQ